eukprot:scaffold68094_cov34-Prasinocladus_malaysianus.AAC.1
MLLTKTEGTHPRVVANRGSQVARYMMGLIIESLLFNMLPAAPFDTLSVASQVVPCHVGAGMVPPVALICPPNRSCASVRRNHLVVCGRVCKNLPKLVPEGVGAHWLYPRQAA